MMGLTKVQREIIDLLIEMDGEATIAELAAARDCDRSSIYPTISRLIERGWVEWTSRPQRRVRLLDPKIEITALGQAYIKVRGEP